MKLLSNGFAFLLIASLFFVGCSNSNGDATKESVPSKDSAATEQPAASGDHNQIIMQIKSLADQGKGVGADTFAIGANRTDIEKAWGKNDEIREDGLFYKKQQVAIYYDETNTKLDQIVSYSPLFAGITYKEVVAIVGKPLDEKKDEGNGDIFYKTQSGKYDLTFTFTGVTASGMDQATLQSVTVGTVPEIDPDQVGK